jgi:hypothetical protein
LAFASTGRMPALGMFIRGVALVAALQTGSVVASRTFQFVNGF